jgi:hypothetical protein
MFAIAALQNWHMRSLDVQAAFLYGELDEKLYMEQPEGFVKKGHERQVFHLKKALYGLKQAALQWWRVLDKSMSKLGFRCIKSDLGIFVLSGQSSPAVICIVYVDDTIFIGPDIHHIDKLKAAFMNIWECRDLGETKEFLQMNIHCQGKTIVLEQKDYLKKVLECFNMHNAKSIPTPLPMGYVPMPNPNNVDEQLRMHYQ